MPRSDIHVYLALEAIIAKNKSNNKYIQYCTSLTNQSTSDVWRQKERLINDGNEETITKAKTRDITSFFNKKTVSKISVEKKLETQVAVIPKTTSELIKNTTRTRSISSFFTSNAKVSVERPRKVESRSEESTTQIVPTSSNWPVINLETSPIQSAPSTSYAIPVTTEIASFEWPQFVYDTPTEINEKENKSGSVQSQRGTIFSSIEHDKKTTGYNKNRYVTPSQQRTAKRSNSGQHPLDRFITKKSPTVV